VPSHTIAFKENNSGGREWLLYQSDFLAYFISHLCTHVLCNNLCILCLVFSSFAWGKAIMVNKGLFVAIYKIIIENISWPHFDITSLAFSVFSN